MGPGIAELLAKNGHEVTLATRGEHIGEYQRYTREIPHTLRDLRNLGVRLKTETAVIPSGASSVTLTSHSVSEEVEFDNIILVGTRMANHGIYTELNARKDDWEANEINNVFRIGDSVRPHFIAEAIFSGHRLGREIDSDEPSRPLPFIRERRIIGSTENDYVLGAKSLSPIY
jgi:dimethylamine/trimethylamine dehydrogenase